jgi:hypothetical protein
VREDGRTVAPDMLVEPDAGASLGHDRCERGLADLKRLAPQVVPVQLADQVEGVQEDTGTGRLPRGFEPRLSPALEPIGNVISQRPEHANRQRSP